MRRQYSTIVDPGIWTTSQGDCTIRRLGEKGLRKSTHFNYEASPGFSGGSRSAKITSNPQVLLGVRLYGAIALVMGPGGKRIMWVDPEHGAITVRVHDEMPGGSTYDLHYGDIRMVAGRGWLPYECTEYLPGGRVLRAVVTKVDFGKIPDDTFRIEFPEPIAMVNLDKGRSYRPRKIWDLSRLPTENSVETAPLKTSLSVPDPVMPGERESHTLLFTFIALGLWAIVGLVGFLWRRGTLASR